jgi:tRNA modification GTPase
MPADCVRAALLTPAGRGALAVVGVAGPGAEALVSRLFTPRGGRPLASRPDGAIAFGRWGDGAGGPGEDLVVVRRRMDDLEIHCHGGLAASEAVIGGLERLGARRIAWPDWLRSGGQSEIEVEVRAALARAAGPQAARILTRQLAGALDAACARVRDLVDAGKTDAAQAAIDRLLRAARVGLRLVRPWRVVLAGRVNAGKSSLVNALAGHARSIVSPEPGTTRDLLETRVVIGGWEMDIVDAAGERDAEDAAGATAVERAGIAKALAARGDADLVIRVVDVRDAVAAAPGATAELLVVTKTDLDQDRSATLPERAIRTSAVTGEGIDALAEAIVQRLVPEESAEPDLLAGAVPFTDRQVAVLRVWRRAL